MEPLNRLYKELLQLFLISITNKPIHIVSSKYDKALHQDSKMLLIRTLTSKIDIWEFNRLTNQGIEIYLINLNLRNIWQPVLTMPIKQQRLNCFQMNMEHIWIVIHNQIKILGFNSNKISIIQYKITCSVAFHRISNWFHQIVFLKGNGFKIHYRKKQFWILCHKIRLQALQIFQDLARWCDMM